MNFGGSWSMFRVHWRSGAAGLIFGRVGCRPDPAPRTWLRVNSGYFYNREGRFSSVQYRLLEISNLHQYPTHLNPNSRNSD